MKTEKTTVENERVAEKPSPAPAVQLRCKVRESGLIIGEVMYGSGAVVLLTSEQAAALGKKVEVVGI